MPYNPNNLQGRDRLRAMEEWLVDSSLSISLNPLAYGTTVATNCALGSYCTLVITDGVAFAFSAPTNPSAGQLLTYDIKNSSGGAHGAITWNAAFLGGGAGTVGTAAFSGIASTKRRLIVFRYDGTTWQEVSRTADQ